MPLRVWAVSASEKVPFFESAPRSWFDRGYVSAFEQLED